MTAIRTLTLLALLAAPLGAQSLAERVRRLDDGTAEFRFAAREGVCGDGAGMIGIGRNTQIINDGEGYGRNWRRECLPGPVRVRLTMRGGDVQNLRASVGEPRRADEPDADLGTVPAAEAARFLLELAERGGSGRVADRAILPAVLADSAKTWPQLLRLARDDSRPKNLRTNAAHWLGRQAAAAASGTDLLAEDDDSDDDDTSVRTSAVFALSQMPREEGVPPLINVARTNRDPHVRRAALFWLGQSLDPRALDLFEEILRKKG